MKKIYLTSFFATLFLLSQSQITSVNIGQNIGYLDSTFVISSGTSSTYNNINHPGAGPYMNAEILLCDGATLTYDYNIGTSNIVTFYLENNSTLILPISSQNTLANIYLKNNATIQMPSANSIYVYMKRESGTNVAGLPITYMSDSIFSTINFTFSGWLNPCLPSSINSNTTLNEKIDFQNPIQNKILILSNTYSKNTVVHFYNLFGQKIISVPVKPYQKEIEIDLPKGMISYSIQNENQILQKGKLINTEN